MTDRARLYRASLRQNFSAFAQKVFATLEPGTTYRHNWHLDHLAWFLERVARGEVKRGIINVPPRSGKSIMASVAFPAWVMGKDPTRRILAVSYAEEFARKLSLDTRRIMEALWFEELFPQLQLVRGRQRTMELTTTQQGYRYTAGVGGAVLGRGADLIIVDDPIKAIDVVSEAERRRVAEFYDNTLVTRLNDKSAGAIVIIMQRLHQDDLVGHVLERDDWEVVSLPAIATQDTEHRLSDYPLRVHHRRSGDLLHPAREPREVVEQIRRAQGSLTFQAQYQQEPVPPGGNVIRRDWLCFFDEQPEEFDTIIMSWDTASTLSETSDYSVGTVWGTIGLDYYLLHVERVKMEVPDLRRLIVRLSQEWGVEQTLIENTELGRAIAQDLHHTGEMRALLRRPERDKETRLLAQAARFEARQVHLPRQAPWLGEYMSELLAFPNCTHDDQVDSTSQALAYLTARQPRTREIVRRDPRRRDIIRNG